MGNAFRSGKSSPAVLGLTLLLLAVKGHASPQPFSCRTSTQRPAAEVVVPFGDPELPNMPQQALRLLPGETLCITGRVNEQGVLVDLRLLEPDAADTPLVMLWLERGEKTKLGIRHSFGKSLDYRALTVITRQNVGLPASVTPVAPGATAYKTWSPRVRELLLFGFHFARPPIVIKEPHPPPPDPDQPLPRRGPGGMTSTVGLSLGERRTDLTELNALLIRDGFAPLPQTRVIGGIDADIALWRLRLGFGLWAGGASTQHASTGAEVSSWLVEAGLTTGFDVIRYENLSVFAATGILLGAFYLDWQTEGFNAFRDRVQPWEGDRVDFSHTAAPLEAGVEYLIPLGRSGYSHVWALQLGTRAGWMQQLGGHWQTVDQPPRDIDGPDIDVSGPTFRLLLGVGEYRGRELPPNLQ